MAIEATNVYHEIFVRLALAADHVVYLVDACRVARYREAVGIRVKTGAVYERFLLRYLKAEMAHMRPYEPPAKTVKWFMRLLKARTKLIP